MATPKKKTTSTGSKAKSASSDDSAPPAKPTKGGAKAEKSAAPARAQVVQEKAAPKHHIDPDLIEEIKTELLKKKADLGANVNNELDDMREAAEGHHLADMDDLGGDAHDEETQYKIMELESAELGHIDQALERIQNGTFGVCEVCDTPINPERLRALPFANLCIDCKRRAEVSED